MIGAPITDGVGRITRYHGVIKWPGGKHRELPVLRPYIGELEGRWVEPFVGGGSVFLALGTDREALVNDADPDLIAFYRAIASRDPELVEALGALVSDWAHLGELAHALGSSLGERLSTFRREPLTADEVARHAPARDLGSFHARDPVGALHARIVASVTDKFARLTRLEHKHRVTFSPDQLAVHLETAVRAGYYYHLRDGEPAGTPGARSAEFFFVREFCYGSMFRYNAEGKFNIPYGGRAYNRKGFAAKVAFVTSDALAGALGSAAVHLGDFDAFFDAVRDRLAPTDFVFLDPPYDSDFSAYSNRAFDVADHERLAASIGGLPCRWLLVIKKTPEVVQTYGHLAGRPDVRSATFAKTYTYNVRGRNERRTEHWVLARSESTRKTSRRAPRHRERSR